MTAGAAGGQHSTGSAVAVPARGPILPACLRHLEVHVASGDEPGEHDALHENRGGEADPFDQRQGFEAAGPRGLRNVRERRTDTGR